MPFKCYQCLAKFPSGRACVSHCLEEQQLVELSIYRPHQSGYIATHYGIVPSNMSTSDVHFDEKSFRMTYSSRDGKHTPIAKANKFSATPERHKEEDTLPYDKDDMHVCI